jgi:hypothetical protein
MDPNQVRPPDRLPRAAVDMPEGVLRNRNAIGTTSIERTAGINTARMGCRIR